MWIRHVAVAFAAATALGTAHAQSTPVRNVSTTLRHLVRIV